MSSPPPTPNLADQLQELTREQSAFKVEVESLKEQLKLGKEIGDLRAEFNKTVGSVKLFAVALGIIAAFAGVAGYKTYKDVEQDAEKKIEAESERELSLSRAYGSLSRKEYESAIRIFKEEFDKNPYDLSVAPFLLHAYDETDDWAEAEKVIQRLEQDEQKLSKINNAALFNNIAVIRIGEGVNDPAKLESGIDYLKRSAGLIPGDDEDALTYFHVNSWLAALAAQDIEKAKIEASQIAVQNSTVSLDEWQKVRRWRFFKDLFKKDLFNKKPVLKDQIRKMWEKQRNTLDDMQKGKK